MSMDATKYKPYPAYKDSGVEWLGEVPEHWEVKPIKRIASSNDDVLTEKTPNEYEIEYVDISSVDEVGGIIKKEEMIFKNAPSRARRLVKNGDVIVSTVRTYLKAIAPIKSPNENLVVSTGFSVIRPNKELLPAFATYLFKAHYLIELIISRSVGVSYPAINSSDLVSLKTALPSLEEQHTIATFLDRETEKIDTLIAKQERLIELLQKKRTALISHAVTKGLNPDAPMKDSDVEWLGKIPAHWEVSRLGYESWVRARLGWKGLKAEEYVDDGFVFLSTPNIKSSNIDFENVNYINKFRYDESPEIKLQVGDILLAKDGSTLGTVNVVRSLPRPATVNSSIAVITPNDILNSIFLYYLFESSYMENTIKIIKGGMGVPHLFQEDLNKFYIPLPRLEEQHTIAAFLDHETQKIDTLITKPRHTIDLLKERRTALISAAVTGKIDVREAA